MNVINQDTFKPIKILINANEIKHFNFLILLLIFLLFKNQQKHQSPDGIQQNHRHSKK